MKTPRSHPLAWVIALSALLSPLSAQQDWVTWTTVDGVAPTDQFGTALTGVGDWNQDGYDDYAVSALGSDRNFQNAGLVTIFSGQDDSILAEIDGPLAAEQIGYALVNLGTHADGLPKLAVGAPFASTTNGPFSGVVRIYSWDNATSTLSMLTELLGPAPGALFGSSLAALDLDADGNMDLAVGAMGAHFQDGEVSTFAMSGAGAATPAVAVYPGALGSMEMFGWAISRANATTGGGAGGGGLPVDGLLVGAPFADDLAVDAGAAVLIDGLGGQTTLTNPFANTANAHLGYSVSAGYDAWGDPVGDMAAGAPDTANGSVALWNGSTLGVINLDGDAPGDRFGYTVTFSPDANFDNRADLAVGAPGASNNQGALKVYSLAMGPMPLHAATGPVGAGQMGWSIGLMGDLNQTGKTEIGLAAPQLNSFTGYIEVFSPPAQDIGPIVLTASGSFEWETDVQLTATNLSPGGGGSIYWYVGTQATNSTSPEGYDLNIGGQLSLIASGPNPGIQASQLYHILDVIPDGTTLYFQMVEDRNGFVRVSGVDSGVVVDPGVTLFVNGNTAGAPITLQTRWGIPNSPVYIYATSQGFSQQANNPVPNGDWMVNLLNPRFIGQPGDKSGPLGAPDEGEFTSNPINVPGGFVGVTGYFQAYDWDLFLPALTNVVAVTFQ